MDLFCILLSDSQGSSRECSDKKSACLCRRHKMWVWSLGQEAPLKEGMATHSSILAWKIPRTEEPADYDPWGHKESDMTEWLSTHAHKRIRKNPKFSLLYSQILEGRHMGPQWKMPGRPGNWRWEESMHWGWGLYWDFLKKGRDGAGWPV